MTCPVCFSSDVTAWPTVGLTKCDACAHIWQTVVEKTVDYGREYVERGYVNRNVPTENMAWVRVSFMYLFAQSGKVLDIGYGDGAFVRVARKAGYDAFGYDVHAEKFDDVPTVDRLARGFDIVTMFDSLEHFQYLTHPFVTMPDKFIVTVPHVSDDMTEALIVKWRHYKPDEHLHYFSPRSIEKLFVRYGYELFSKYPLEDVIRKNPNAKPNTMTYVFRRV